MTITGVITAILIGTVIGVLGRLVVPGRQSIGVLVTILVGIVSAFIGTAIAKAVGILTATSGVDWLELLVQVIVAAVAIADGQAALRHHRRSPFRTAALTASRPVIPADRLRPGLRQSCTGSDGTAAVNSR
ncbi:hypothetical protein BB170200_02194 [Mycobacterium marinum]|nr:hypothetical protein BB170200_02194 [Mycobacterium marinum]